MSDAEKVVGRLGMSGAMAWAREQLRGWEDAHAAYKEGTLPVEELCALAATIGLAGAVVAHVAQTVRPAAYGEALENVRGVMC